MISNHDFEKYLLNSITYIDGKIDHKIDLIKDHLNSFWISLYIGNIKTNFFDNILYPSIVMDITNVLNNEFPFESILNVNVIKFHKLIVIEKLTSDLFYNEHIKNIFENNKELNITIIILSFNPLKDKNLLHCVDKIIFTKTDDILKVYRNCFLTYPIYDIFQQKMIALNNDQYLIYMKKQNNYISCENRFVTLNYVKSENNNIVEEVEIDDDYNSDEMVLTIEI